MNVDKSATLLYAVVICVTISRLTDNENVMDDDDAEQSAETTHNPLLRQRPKSASIDRLTTVSTSETPDHRRQHYHVASFYLSYVSTPFITSLWIVLSTVAKIGQLISGCIAGL